MATTKKYKTFVDYYHEDPEFRERHLEKMKGKVRCACGFETARGNLSRHQKSRHCIAKMEKINRIIELEKELTKLRKDLNK